MSDETERKNPAEADPWSLDDSIRELRSITRCLCDAAWTEHRKHAPECVAYCREDVDLLAQAVAERDEALGLLREWVYARDIYASPDSYDRWMELGKKARALVERTSQGDADR